MRVQSCPRSAPRFPGSTCGSQAWRRKTELREALADRKVLVFRDQDLSPHQYADFLRVFGTPVKEDMVVDGNHPPEVGAIHTRPNEQQQINFWHMDHSFRELPTRVLSLYAKLLPPVGGDTLFASLAAAYDALSDELKERIEGLHCYHRVTTTQNTKRRHTKEEAEAMENAPPVVHPLVPRDPGMAGGTCSSTYRSIAAASSSFQRRKATSCCVNCIVTPRGRNSIFASPGDRIPSSSGRTTTRSTIRCPTTSRMSASSGVA